jgi:Flp pilus assembly CpaF family ATPase
VRGAEALTLVHSLRTGHKGSVFTIHGPGRHHTIQRLHEAVALAQPNYAYERVKESVKAVVQIGRVRENGGLRRKVTDIWLTRDD